MYIDFEDYRPDTPRVEAAMSPGTVVLISLILHTLVVLALIYLPSLPMFRTVPATPVAGQPDEPPRFVFMAPRVDRSKPQPRPNVDASDQDRVASSIKRQPDPKNSAPLARGNSPERVEADQAQNERALREQEAANAARQNQRQMSEGEVAANDPSRSILRLPDMPAAPVLQVDRNGSGGGPLGEALRNLQRYVQNQSFDNPQGGGDAQGLIQFDSRGVEFGPWLRRFVAQVKRNWFIPTAAMMLKGHVVITFNVHKDGALTDIEVRAPSNIDAFNNAAVNALISSNPTQPLPPEYPADSAFFTVTFLYNEEPPANYR